LKSRDRYHTVAVKTAL